MHASGILNVQMECKINEKYKWKKTAEQQKWPFFLDHSKWHRITENRFDLHPSGARGRPMRYKHQLLGILFFPFVHLTSLHILVYIVVNKHGVRALKLISPFIVATKLLTSKKLIVIVLLEQQLKKNQYGSLQRCIE